jgi:hypothetical protein
MFIRMGAFDGDPAFAPADVCTSQAAAVWEPIPEDGLPRFPGFAGG